MAPKSSSVAHQVTPQNTFENVASDFKLKKPVIVYVFAALFMLAPLGNTAMSIFVLYPSAMWLDLGTWQNLINNFMPSTWLWMGLEIVAGIGLFFQRKSTWTFALGVLVFSILYQLFVVYPLKQYPTAAIVTAVMSTLAVSVIFYHFRFPYLDRRDNWLKGMSKRHYVDVSVRIINLPEHGTLSNISRSGLKMIYPSMNATPKIGEVIQFELPVVPPVLIQATVIRKHDRECGMKFVNLTREQKKAVIEFIRRQNQQLA